MKKSVFIIVAALVALGAFSAAGSLSAQGESPEALYARGVYLFFNGRYDEAEDSFRRGTSDSPDNPVNFYFLGVIQLRLGQTEAAEESFTKGAQAELTPHGRLVDVPGHLLRIQGNERLLIEQIRRAAGTAGAAWGVGRFFVSLTTISSYSPSSASAISAKHGSTATMQAAAIRTQTITVSIITAPRLNRSILIPAPLRQSNNLIGFSP